MRSISLRSSTRWSSLLSLALVGLLAGCEPPDGGGGGIGGRLAFIRDGELHVSLDDGNGERALTDANTSAEPALSPNGQNIAFAYNAQGNPNARGISLIGFSAGSQLQELAPAASGTSYGEPTWDRSGQNVVFVVNDGTTTHLAKVAIGGGEVQSVAPSVTDVHFPVFLDDNTLLVVAGAGLALSTVDIASGTVSPLGPTTISRAAVSADGKKIAYAKDENGGRIVVRDVATGAETVLPSSGMSGDVKPAFAPDGSAVAFESMKKIWMTKVTGDGAVEPLQSGTDVAWGP